jgi:hypothetical protein
MKQIEKLFFDIGENGDVFWYGWLSGVIGIILGLLIGHAIFG